MTDDTNSLLVGDFTRQEVEIALKQMTHLKVTRPNGMPPIFSNSIGVILEMMSLRLLFRALIWGLSYLVLIILILLFSLKLKAL